MVAWKAPPDAVLVTVLECRLRLTRVGWTLFRNAAHTLFPRKVTVITRSMHPLHSLLLVLPMQAVLGMAQPWDLRRFAKTAFFFNKPEDVLQRMLPDFVQSEKVIQEDGTIWSAQNRMLEWGPLDDVVMGGVSESNFVVADGIGKFSGAVSTENNGGFCGCRTKALTPPLVLGRYSALKLRVRGDGRRYKFIVRDSYAWNGIAWSQSFQPSAEWQDVELPFRDFVPTLFAKRVPGARLNTDAINTMQLTYSKFEYDDELNPAFGEGPFDLCIESIRVV